MMGLLADHKAQALLEIVEDLLDIRAAADREELSDGVMGLARHRFSTAEQLNWIGLMGLAGCTKVTPEVCSRGCGPVCMLAKYNCDSSRYERYKSKKVEEKQ